MGGSGRGCCALDPVAGGLVDGADRVEGVGLTGPGWSHQHGHPVVGSGERPHRRGLVGTKRRSRADHGGDDPGRERCSGRPGGVGGLEEAALDREQLDGSPPVAVVADRDHERRGHDSGDDTLEGGHRGSLPDAGRDGLYELGAGEGRVGLGQLPAQVRYPLLRVHDPVDHDGPGRGLDVLGKPPPLGDIGHLAFAGGGDKGFGGVRSPAGVEGLGLPGGVEAFVFDLGLGAPRGEHGFLAASGVVWCAGCFEPVLDLAGSLGEQVAEGLGDTGDLGDVTAGPPLEAEPFGELGPQDGLEHLARCARGAVEAGRVERRPASVGPFDEVGDQGVPVQQRVTGPAGAMPERRGDYALSGQCPDPGRDRRVGVPGGEVVEERRVSRAPPDVDRFALQPAQGCADRELAGVDDRALHPRVVRHGVEDRHRLGGLEGQVEPRYSARVRKDRLAVRSETARPLRHSCQHCPQVVRGDLAGEPEAFGTGADPTARCFSGARVVVVERLRDPGELVGLLADTELGDAEHPTSEPNRGPEVGPGQRPEPDENPVHTSWCLSVNEIWSGPG
ncbi:hypothetical protein BH18ACI1_BH18ACI1_23040 [soil metagenome]